MAWTRKRNKYSKPKKAYDKVRIEEENVLVEKYGLKNKKEIWKAESKIKRIRDQAKKLITASVEEQEKLISKLNSLGLKVKTTADVLELNKEDLLKRRLQSVLILNNMAKPKEARQLISHKHIRINDKVVNIPSYLVELAEEKNIRITRKTKEMRDLEKKEKENGKQ